MTLCFKNIQIYFYKKETRCWWCTVILLAFGKWRLEDREVQGHSQLSSEFKAILAYLRPGLKKKIKRKKKADGNAQAVHTNVLAITTPKRQNQR